MVDIVNVITINATACIEEQYAVLANFGTTK